MPPVLGPVSPSPRRLWSCAGGRIWTCSPSVRARTESSSPSRNCSTTISRHAGGTHYVFGKGLGRFEPRGRLRGPERRPARRAQAIDEARGEGSLGPHDGEVDPVAGDGRRELVHRGGRDLEVAAVPRGARVAGGGAEGRVGEVALQRPAERVLAAAPADDQDPHFFFKASAKAW